MSTESHTRYSQKPLAQCKSHDNHMHCCSTCTSLSCVSVFLPLSPSLPPSLPPSLSLSFSLSLSLSGAERSEFSRKEDSGFTHNQSRNPVTFQPQEAYLGDFSPVFTWRPTGTSVMKHDFHTPSLPTVSIFTDYLIM